jgi:type I restriction enzyme, S subunit
MNIPTGWKKVKFGEVVSKVNDKVPNRDEWTFDRYIGGQHFDEGEIRVTQSAPIKGNEEVIGSAFSSRFKLGHVLYVTRNPRLRKGGMVDFEGVCSNVSFVMQADETKLLQSLLPFIIQTEDFVTHTCNNAHGSTNPFLNWKDIANYEFLLPPMEEQKKISEMLWSIERNIKKIELHYKEKEFFHNKLVKHLVYRGLDKNPKMRKTKYGTINYKFDIGKIQKFIDEKYILSHLDGNHGSNYPKNSEFVNEGTKYVSATMIKNGELDWDQVRYLTQEKANKLKKGRAKDGDVLLANNAVVGPTTILKTDDDYVVLSTSLTYYRCNPEKLNNKYLLYYFRSNFFQNQLFSVMKQSTRNQVPITTQRKLLLVVPDLKSQNEIVKILHSSEKELRCIYNSNIKNRNLRNKLSNELLKGGLKLK